MASFQIKWIRIDSFNYCGIYKDPGSPFFLIDEDGYTIYLVDKPSLVLIKSFELYTNKIKLKTKDYISPSILFPNQENIRSIIKNLILTELVERMLDLIDAATLQNYCSYGTFVGTFNGAFAVSGGDGKWTYILDVGLGYTPSPEFNIMNIMSHEECKIHGLPCELII